MKEPSNNASGLTRRDLLNVVSGTALLTAAASAADDTARSTTPAASGTAARRASLYPHDSASRASRDLSGVWEFRLDPADEGEAALWSNGLSDTRPIPVPSSWNELFDDARNYFGTAWYQTEFFVDAAWSGRRIHLRFGSANYRAKAWLNGQLLGEHLGGHLPFVFEVTGIARHRQLNRLVVLVENKLREDRVPASASEAGGFGGGFPAVTFDFFPYCGLHRPVILYSTPRQHIDDLTVTTSFDGTTGIVDVAVSVSDQWSGSAELAIGTPAGTVAVNTRLRAGRGRAQLRLPQARAWGPADPYLYALTVSLGGQTKLDEYHLRIGVRTIEVRGDQLLLNGQPVFLAGFGKHEDFPIHGRGLDIPVIVRDFELLRWINANSFRTSHYPYSDEAMMLADQYGLLVIAETPAVSLSFTDGNEIIAARYRQHRQALAELMARDKNHPCVVVWSLANEPGLRAPSGPGTDRQQMIERGSGYFRPLFELARSTDPSRPVVLVGVGNGPDEWVGMGDIICVNLYYGWYYGGPGQLEEVAQAALDKEITRLRSVHNKPLMLTEFGADTVAGSHALPEELWSEEYQAQMMEVYMRVIRRHAYVIGAHPWAFADFRTTQGILRAVGLNHKGVFTRERGPKLAAHKLRELWRAR